MKPHIQDSRLYLDNKPVICEIVHRETTNGDLKELASCVYRDFTISPDCTIDFIADYHRGKHGIRITFNNDPENFVEYQLMTVTMHNAERQPVPTFYISERWTDNYYCNPSLAYKATSAASSPTQIHTGK